MKRISVVMFLMLAVLAANCQKKDQTFEEPAWFKAGLRIGADPTIYLEFPTGTGVVTWGSILDKPLLFAPATHTQAWSTITGRPTTLAGYGITDASSIIHTHSLLYKPIDYVPLWNDVLGKPVFSAVATTGSFNDLRDVPEFIEIEEALPLLDGIKLPVLTQAEINALIPVKGLLLFNDTEGVLQIYGNSGWKVIMTNL